MPSAKDFTLSHDTVDAAGLVYNGGPKEVDEGIADGAVTPGAVVVQGTNENDVQEPGSAGVTNILGIALENDFEGTDPEDQSDTGDIDTDHPWLDDFADGEPVDYNKAVGGEHRMIFNDRAGNNIGKGDLMRVGANGTVEEYQSADADDSALFRALEDIDSTRDGERVRVKRVS